MLEQKQQGKNVGAIMLDQKCWSKHLKHLKYKKLIEMLGQNCHDKNSEAKTLGQKFWSTNAGVKTFWRKILGQNCWGKTIMLGDQHFGKNTGANI